MKKGRLSGKEGLDRAQVHNGRVHLDLPEIRVHGRVEGEVAGEPVLHVGSQRPDPLGAVLERIARLDGAIVRLREAVGRTST